MIAFNEATKDAPHIVTLKKRECLVPPGDPVNRESYRITFAFADSRVCLSPGRAIGVLVKNAPEVVQRAGRLGITDAESKNLTGFVPKATVRQGDGILDMLERGQQVDVPIPDLAPRNFSICNSPLVHPGIAQIVYSMAEIRDEAGKLLRYGVASEYLKALPEGSAVAIFPRSIDSGFRLPPVLGSPIVMVAAGTGVAPFLGFLQHIQADRQNGSPSECILYYGVRDASSYLFKDELAEFPFLTLHLAVSRPDRVYVQHLVKRDAAHIYSILAADGLFYICGDEMTMVRDVNAVLQEVCTAASGNPKMLLELTKARRILRDIWV